MLAKAVFTRSLQSPVSLGSLGMNDSKDQEIEYEQ